MGFNGMGPPPADNSQMYMMIAVACVCLLICSMVGFYGYKECWFGGEDCPSTSTSTDTSILTTDTTAIEDASGSISTDETVTGSGGGGDSNGGGGGNDNNNNNNNSGSKSWLEDTKNWSASGIPLGKKVNISCNGDYIKLKGDKVLTITKVSGDFPYKVSNTKGNSWRGNMRISGSSGSGYYLVDPDGYTACGSSGITGWSLPTNGAKRFKISEVKSSSGGGTTTTTTSGGGGTGGWNNTTKNWNDSPPSSLLNKPVCVVCPGTSNKARGEPYAQLEGSGGEWSNILKIKSQGSNKPFKVSTSSYGGDWAGGWRFKKDGSKGYRIADPDGYLTCGSRINWEQSSDGSKAWKIYPASSGECKK